MVKFIFWFVFITVAVVFYTDGFKPYLDARKETRMILRGAGIPISQMNTDTYRTKAQTLLKKKCSSGYLEKSLYDYRCASRSHLKFIDQIM